MMLWAITCAAWVRCIIARISIQTSTQRQGQAGSVFLLCATTAATKRRAWNGSQGRRTRKVNVKEQRELPGWPGEASSGASLTADRAYSCFASTQPRDSRSSSRARRSSCGTAVATVATVATVETAPADTTGRKRSTRWFLVLVNALSSSGLFQSHVHKFTWNVKSC